MVSQNDGQKNGGLGPLYLALVIVAFLWGAFTVAISG